jgi:hypothetical protein
MQSASDIFLGWGTTKAWQHFYVRQLHDIKLKPAVEQFISTDMIQSGESCGWALARKRARSGEPAVNGWYLGNGDTFDKAFAAFSIAYANQTERDHKLLKKGSAHGQTGSGDGTMIDLSLRLYCGW